MKARKRKVGEVYSFPEQQETFKLGLQKFRAIRFPLMAWCALFICLLASAPLCQAQAPIHVPGACQGIQTELNSLISERNDLQSQLKMAAPGEKSGLAGQVKALIPKITAKQKELDNCAKTNGGLPDANTNFKGNATMTTNNSNLTGPFVQGVNISAFYPHWLHDQIRITNFPAVKVGPFSTPAGNNTTTVTLIDNGNGPVVKATGEMEITVKLHFHHSLAIVADSDLLITVSTETAGGSRLKANGSATLVGTSTFQGGYLNGNTCKLVITGTFSQLP